MQKSKSLLLTGFLLSLLLVVGVTAASPPSLVAEHDLSSNIPAGATSVSWEMFPGAVAITYNFGGSAHAKIFRLSDGAQLYSETQASAGVGGMDVSEDVFVWCTDESLSGRIHVVDVSDLSFISEDVHFSIGITLDAVRECTILDVLGNEVSVGTSTPSTDSVRVMNRVNGNQSDSFNPSGSMLDDIVAIDRVNKVYATGDELYSYDPITNHSLIFTLPVANGDFFTFNLDSNSPSYTTTTGNKVVANTAYDDVKVTGAAHNTSFLARHFIADSLIYASLGGRWANIDFSDNVAPTEETFTTLIGGGFGTSSLIEQKNTRAGDKFVTFNDTTRELQVWEFDEAAVANEDPVITATFLGSDIGVDNFLFDVDITDAEGGTIFEAHRLVFGDDFLIGSKVQNIEFTDATDLSLVSTSFDCGMFRLDYDNNVSNFGSDGALIVSPLDTNLTFCPPVFIDLDDFDQSDGNIVVLDTQFAIQAPLNLSAFCVSPVLCPVFESSITLKNSLTTLGQVRIEVDNPETNATGFRIVFLPDETTEITGTYNETRPFRMTATLDFDAQDVTYEFFHAGVSVGSFTKIMQPIQGTHDTLTSMRFFDEGNSDTKLLVDYVRVSQDTTIANNPAYTTFGFSTAGQTLSRLIQIPIPNADAVIEFGDYTARFFASDEQKGIGDFTTFIDVDFTFNQATPAYTDEQVDAIEDTIEGDDEGFLTEAVSSLLDSIGINSPLEKFFFGIAIIIIAAIALVQTVGVPLTILIEIALIIGLTIAGIFPGWFTAIFAIIALAIVAKSLTSLFAGNGGDSQ